jgi:hypothetical protein
MTFDGDLLLDIDPVTMGWDISIANGQPVMTSGLETCVLLAVFGGQNVQNGMIDNPAERFDSTFPAVIRRATVCDATRNDGIAAIEKALAFLTSEGIASAVRVSGSISSAYRIDWPIEIDSPQGGGRYSINWDKGSLTFGSMSGGR